MSTASVPQATRQPEFDARERVVVVGAGPAGLAAAAALKRRGIDPLLLDKAEVIGASWRSHYDRLHLHTVRWLSNLPGKKIPRSEGRWVSREGVIRYLEDYATFHDLRVQLSTELKALNRKEEGWLLDTTRGPIEADSVVIATGFNQRPVIPAWPGVDGFSGELVHSARYRNARPYVNKDVLIVGAGNSGAEIAVDLIETGARKVWLSVRSGPNILHRDFGGVPTQAMGVMMRRLPPRLVDRVAALFARITVGDLTKHGMPAPEWGLTAAVKHERIPILDVGLIGALKKGQVEVVPAVEGFEGPEVLLAGGSRLRPDAVIASTGFERGLEDILGPLGVLDADGDPLVRSDTTHEKAPNLYFTGYTNPISGMFRELGIDARKIARAVASKH
jgi:putative flavoprotein involved in K+ transport